MPSRRLRATPAQQFRRSLKWPRRSTVLFVLLGAVALLGGGAREDIVSLVVLRPLSWAFLAYAIATVPAGAASGRGPIVGVILLGLLTLVQLVPLPHGVWSTLAGRETIATIGDAIGVGTIARPLSLSPGETLNAFLSLAVPAAVLLLMRGLSPHDRNRALIAVLILALVNAALGVAQLAGSPEGPLYFYRVTNFGEPVGLFANRNHSAVLNAVTIVILGWWTGRRRHHVRTRDDYRFVGFAFAVPFLLLLNVIGGSRLGLAVGILALLPGFALALRNERVRRGLARTGMGVLAGRHAVLGSAVLAGAIIGLAAFVSRSQALDRFMVTDASSEMRAQLLPIFGRMISAFMPWGSGFGTFERIYPAFEPVEMIESRYLNQAHNDLAQWLIEGGLPGAVLLLVATLWFTMRCVALFRARRTEGFLDRPAFPAAMAIVLIAVASLFDYPMRTPTFMAIVAVFAVLIDRNEKPPAKLEDGDGAAA